MCAERTILTPALLTASLAITTVLANSPCVSAGDLRSQRPMSGVPAAATTPKAANRAAEPKPYIPPRPPGLRPGDQIDFVYDGRTKSYSFGQPVAIKKAGWNSAIPSAEIVHDHRGKTASKPPGTPPGSPPPAAAPIPVSGPPAAPPGTVATPPASGNIVRVHENQLMSTVTTSKVKDHREGYGGDKYEMKSFRTSTGETFTVRPRQKPPCFGDACWFFGR